MATAPSETEKIRPRNETAAPNFVETHVEEAAAAGDDSRQRPFADAYHLNRALNELATQAGDSREPVISRAVAAEELWRGCKPAATAVTNGPDGALPWQPDTVSLNTVLKAWAKAATVLVEQHSVSSTPSHLLDSRIPVYAARDCAERAQALLMEVVVDQDETVARPDVQSYNTVLDAWAKSRTPEALSHVQALLQHMKKQTIPLDLFSFTSLMEAYAYSDEADRLQEIQNIWNQMEASDDDNLRPTAQSLTVVLHAYSRTASQAIQAKDHDQVRRIGDQAHALVCQQEERYEESQDERDLVEVQVYTTAMDVLSKVGTPEAAHRAEGLWQRLRAQNENKSGRGTKPTIYTYTTLISAWSRVTHLVPQATQRIKDVLEEVWENDYIYKNSRPFAAALRGYARSGFPLAEPNKAIVALETVKRIREDAKENPSMRPNRSVYHAAIDCCIKILSSQSLQEALTKDGSTVHAEKVALKIAFALLQSMQIDEVTPNGETYAKLLWCTKSLLPPGDERDQIALSLLAKAQAAGAVDQYVLKSLQQTLDSTLWHGFVTADNLVDDRGKLDFRKVPHAWKRNAA
jgi:hypothetical protein